MQFKLSLPVTRLKWAPYPHTRGRFRPGYPTRDLSHHISRFKLVGQSSSDKWKLNEIDASTCFSHSPRSGDLLLLHGLIRQRLCCCCWVFCPRFLSLSYSYFHGRRKKLIGASIWYSLVVKISVCYVRMSACCEIVFL